MAKGTNGGQGGANRIKGVPTQEQTILDVITGSGEARRMDLETRRDGDLLVTDKANVNRPIGNETENKREKVRAKNNRTTYVRAEETDELRGRLTQVSELKSTDLNNRTIHGQIEEVAEKLPRSFVDLLFIDPPYNLNKDFGNNKFRAKRHDDYESHFEGWLLSIMHTLKTTASVYACCDWKSSPMIFNQALGWQKLKRSCAIRR